MSFLAFVLPLVAARASGLSVTNPWGAWKFAAGAVLLLPAFLHLLLLMRAWRIQAPSQWRATWVTALTFLIILVPYLRLNLISGDEPRFIMTVDSLVSDGNFHVLAEHRALHHRRWIDSELSDTVLLKGWSIHLDRADTASDDRSYAFPAWPIMTAPFYWLTAVLLEAPTALVRVALVLPNILLFFLALARLDQAADALAGRATLSHRWKPGLILFTPFAFFAQAALPEMMILAVVSDLTAMVLEKGAVSRRIWFLALVAPWIHARAMPATGLLLLLVAWHRGWRFLGAVALYLASFGAKLAFDAATGLGYFLFSVGEARNFLGDPHQFLVAYSAFLFDADCGLAPFYPLAALALVPGLAALARPAIPRERHLALASLACLAFPAMFDYWNAGYGIGRYQLSYLAILYPSIMARWDDFLRLFARRPWSRFLGGAALVSLVSTIVFSLAQTLFALLPSGGLYTRFGIDLGYVLPAASRLTRPEWAVPAVQFLTPWLAAAWSIGYLVLALFLIRRLEKRT